MITLHKSESRGHTHLGWLDSRHTFSFGEYHNPSMMGFRTLRVINDDRVQAGLGFGTHPHRDMEIITYVLRGSLEHQDSLGNGSTIHAGELQVMSAGSGITHSEFNPSKEDDTHLLQIWIRPDEKGIEPRYDQKIVDLDTTPNEWKLLVSGFKEDGLVKIHQDAKLLAGKFDTGFDAVYPIEENRGGWLHVISGTIQTNDYTVSEGDALEIDAQSSIDFTVIKNAEVLLFDLT